MGLLGDLFKTAIDVDTTPLDIIDDVASTLEGQRPTSVKNKIKKVGSDVKDCVDDVADVDLI